MGKGLIMKKITTVIQRDLLITILANEMYDSHYLVENQFTTKATSKFVKYNRYAIYCKLCFVLNTDEKPIRYNSVDLTLCFG